VPLLVIPALAAGVAYGIPKARTYVVIRDDAVVDSDASYLFSSDRTAVRAPCVLATDSHMN